MANKGDAHEPTTAGGGRGVMMISWIVMIPPLIVGSEDAVGLVLLFYWASALAYTVWEGRAGQTRGERG